MVDALGSFVIFFATGVLGASLYLVLQLVVDSNLTVLINRIIPNMTVMGILYVLSGGVFAAVVQESTGNLFQLTSMETVLLLGFGWQGALSGVGSAQRAATANTQGGTVAKEQSDQNWQTLVAMKNNEIEGMKNELENYSKTP